MTERKRPPVPDDVWTSEQVAVYFQISERTLRDWRDRDATFPQQLDLSVGRAADRARRGSPTAANDHPAPHLGPALAVLTVVQPGSDGS